MNLQIPQRAYRLHCAVMLTLLCVLALSPYVQGQSTQPESSVPATQSVSSTQPFSTKGFLTGHSPDGDVWLVLHDDKVGSKGIKSRVYVGQPEATEESARGLEQLFISDQLVLQMVVIPSGVLMLDEEGKVWRIRRNSEQRLTTDPKWLEPEEVSLPSQEGVILQIGWWKNQMMLLRRLGQDPAFGTVELLIRNGSRWEALPLPDLDLSWRTVKWVRPIGADDRLILQIGDADESQLWVSEHRGLWQVYDQAMKGPTQAGWHVIDRQIYLLNTSEAGYQLSLWRQDKWWPMKLQNWPEGLQSVTWGQGQGHLILTGVVSSELRGEGEEAINQGPLTKLKWWPILANNGALGQARDMSTEKPVTRTMINPMFIATLVALVLSFAGTFKLWFGAGQRQLNLPAHFGPAGLMKRSIAFLIDLTPGAGLAMLIFGISDPASLFQEYWPTNGVPMEKMLPGTICLIIWATHTTVTEIMTGTTLGKRIFGLRVLTMQGEKASPLAIIYRNVFKPLEAIGYLLIIVPFFTRTRQRVGDFASQTVVVMRVEPVVDEQQGQDQGSSQ